MKNLPKVFITKINDIEYSFEFTSIKDSHNNYAWIDSWNDLFIESDNFGICGIFLNSDRSKSNWYPVVSKKIYWQMPFYDTDDIYNDSKAYVHTLFNNSLTNEVKASCEKILLLSEFW